MNSRVKKVIMAHLKEKEGASYTEPLRKQMPNFPYYNEQEQSYTDLSQMDSQHGTMTDKERYEKMLVHPDSEWQNVDWGGGDYQAPYKNEIVDEMFRTPNNPETLHDPQRMPYPYREKHLQASEYDIIDLNTKSASSIDNFLDSNKFLKVSSMDLTDFMKISEDTLIHKSNKDLWEMFSDKEGNIYIKRMFDDKDILKG